MTPRATMAGLNMSQWISFAGFVIGCVTIWIHLEISIAQVNVDLANLKQDMLLHKSDNRKDLELLQNSFNTDTKEILRKVDEIQIYLRNRR
jgi:hypothetical protein